MTRIEKPWLVLIWDDYYPSGALRNIAGAFESHTQADSFIRSETEGREGWQRRDHYQIVNIVDYIQQNFG